MITRIFDGAADSIPLDETAPVSCEETVTQLFEEARDDVYRYLLVLGLSPAQAQEATQEVFRRLYVVLQRGKRIESLRGWIFRVAHNHGISVRVRESATVALDAELENQLLDEHENPERDLLDRERTMRIHEAVSCLSERQQNCLYLRAEGFRYREIANILGVSDSTVGEFLRRAIKRLRRAVHA
jgi:RNA polymerase sigma-70 factor (ECF subfamily)